MKHPQKLLALFAVLTLIATAACHKEDTTPTPQPEPEQFTLTGTSWVMVQDEWWTSTMHVIDTSIWRFHIDSTGTINEHFIYNDDDPYGVETYPMTYTFDASMMTGVLYGYEYPLEFTYHPEDTTLTYICEPSVYAYHLLEEP